MKLFFLYLKKICYNSFKIRLLLLLSYWECFGWYIFPKLDFKLISYTKHFNFQVGNILKNPHEIKIQAYVDWKFPGSPEFNIQYELSPSSLNLVQILNQILIFFFYYYFRENFSR